MMNIIDLFKVSKKLRKDDGIFLTFFCILASLDCYLIIFFKKNLFQFIRVFGEYKSLDFAFISEITIAIIPFLLFLGLFYYYFLNFALNNLGLFTERLVKIVFWLVISFGGLIEKFTNKFIAKYHEKYKNAEIKSKTYLSMKKNRDDIKKLNVEMKDCLRRFEEFDVSSVVGNIVDNVELRDIVARVSLLYLWALFVLISCSQMQNSLITFFSETGIFRYFTDFLGYCVEFLFWVICLLRFIKILALSYFIAKLERVINVKENKVLNPS